MIKTLESFPRVSFRFLRLADAKLITFVRNILALVALLTELYPSPSPALTKIATAADDFASAVQQALNGGRIQIGIRKASRRTLLALMRQLAAYIQGNCLDDPQNIVAAGFATTRVPTPSGLPMPPANQRFEYSGKSGELIFRYGPVYNVRNYSVQLALSPDGPWTDQPLATSTRTTITGLTPGKAYWARARANGTAGTSEWGGPATAMAI